MSDDQLLNEDETTAPRRVRSPLLLLALAALLGLGLCLATSVLLLRGEVRLLRPFRGDPTAIALVISGQPQLVTFPELSESAATYLNQRIRVTGYYLPLSPPDCAFFNGPVFNWSLVSEGLQLNAQGFERALALAAPGTALTIEGIWRLHSGPYGCGKGPEPADVWYLQVERIVQPNPLAATTADPAAFALMGISTPMFPTVGPTSTPRPTNQATETPMASLTPSVTRGTGTAVGTPSASPTTSTTGTVTGTATRLFTVTPTGTRPTPVTVTPTLTTPGATNPPPAPTATPPTNPYPGATSPPPLPGATNTPPGY